jgi:hypothetical protein
MSGSCGAGAASPAAGFCGEGGAAEWLCIYDRMEAVGSGWGKALLRGDKKSKFAGTKSAANPALVS